MAVISRAETPEELFTQTAEFILSLAEKSKDKFFTVALAGGSTPKGLYQRMISPQFINRFPWEKMHFFWGDERWVSSSDSRSNERMARESMLSPAGVPESHIHAVDTSLPSPQASAENYGVVIRDFFKSGSQIPRFSLVLLGLGDDGHTASLFPGDPVLNENEKITAAAKLETPEPRITMTYPLINAAENIAFLVSGESKKKILSEIFSKNCPVPYPAMKIRPSSGNLFWFISG